TLDRFRIVKPPAAPGRSAGIMSVTIVTAQGLCKHCDAAPGQRLRFKTKCYDQLRTGNSEKKI
ncbi:hypothetical protein AB4144_27395, partial [Rhizobiaceae sp. 2RAB30]